MSSLAQTARLKVAAVPGVLPIVRSPGGSDLIDLAVLLYFMALVLAAALWLTAAQREYLQLYRSRRGDGPPLPEEVAAYYYLQPWRLLGLAWWYTRFYLSVQADPQVEGARQRLVSRALLIVVLFAIGVAADIFLLSLCQVLWK